MHPHHSDHVDKAIHYIFRYLTWLGCFTYDYNLHQNKLIHRPLKVIYCALMDLFLLLSSKHLMGHWSIVFDSEIFKRRLALFWYTFLFTTNYLCVVVSRIQNWKMRSQIKHIFDELDKVRLIHLAELARNNFEVPVRDELKKIILLKSLCSVTILVISYSSLIYQAQGGSSDDYYWLVVVVLSIMLINSVENQINFGMLYGVYLFKLINVYLTSLVEEIKVSLENDNMRRVNENTDFLCLEFSRIATVHTSVLKLVTEFKNCFQMNILLILMATITAQFYNVFLIVVISDGNFENKGFQITCASFSLVTAFLNLWLLTHICGDIIDSCDAPADILELLPTDVLLNSQLEKMIQSLILQFKQKRMKLSIYGLFELEWASAFLATSAALDYLILIVQFDYYNFKFE